MLVAAFALGLVIGALWIHPTSQPQPEPQPLAYSYIGQFAPAENLVPYWTGVCKVTTYESLPPLGGGPKTKTGHVVHPRLCAVDPAIIPLGSLVEIDSFGFFIAADIGSAVKGRHVDIFRRGGEQPGHPNYGRWFKQVRAWRIRHLDTTTK